MCIGVYRCVYICVYIYMVAGARRRRIQERNTEEISGSVFGCFECFENAKKRGVKEV